MCTSTWRPSTSGRYGLGYWNQHQGSAKAMLNNQQSAIFNLGPGSCFPPNLSKLGYVPLRIFEEMIPSSTECSLHQATGLNCKVLELTKLLPVANIKYVRNVRLATLFWESWSVPCSNPQHDTPSDIYRYSSLTHWERGSSLAIHSESWAAPRCACPWCR